MPLTVGRIVALAALLGTTPSQLVPMLVRFPAGAPADADVESIPLATVVAIAQRSARTPVEVLRELV